jgi:hypothetical protein
LPERRDQLRFALSESERETDMSHVAAEAGTGTDLAAGDVAGQPQGSGQDQSQGAPGSDDVTSEDQGSDEETGDQPDLASELAHWKAMARKHEARAKDNASAARRLKEIEDANKTDLQRAQERAEEAERRAAESDANHHRMMAAAMHDLPVDLIDVLGSGTEEEIGQRAEAIAQAIDRSATELAKRTVQAMGLAWPGDVVGGQPGSAPTAAGAAALAGNRPVESMRPGAIPSGNGAATTREGMFREMLAGS